MVTSRVLRTNDESAWHSYLDRIPSKGLVHFPSYTRVYERYGDGSGECFVYEDGDSVVLYPVLRRAIADSNGLSDTVTPYGYGGAAYVCRRDQQPSALIADFRRAFVNYAHETKTVSEFVRFHPFLQNQEHFLGLMDDVSLSCNNAIIDLSGGAEAVFAHYRTSYQQCIRKAEAAGLRVECVSGSNRIDGFFDLYSETMKRKHQEGYFNFKRDFLIFLTEEIGDDVLCFAVRRGNDLLASALFLYDGHNYLDYFLSASRVDALPLHPNHLLLHHVALWAINRRTRWFHLGGGHKSLEFFKHGFANGSRDYYIGKHVFDRDAYARLSAAHWKQHGQKLDSGQAFFPAYRAQFHDNHPAPSV
jgi:hypothetical protein